MSFELLLTMLSIDCFESDIAMFIWTFDCEVIWKACLRPITIFPCGLKNVTKNHLWETNWTANVDEEEKNT